MSLTQISDMVYQNENKTITVEYDECPPNPREWDNLGTLVFKTRSDLKGEETADSMEELDAIEKNADVFLPIYMYKHSGIALQTGPFGDPWDSGLAGCIYVSREDLRKEYSCKRITKKIREKAEKVLESEIELFAKYVNGEVYSYVVTEECGECKHKHELELGRCAGFFSIKEALECATQEHAVAA